MRRPAESSIGETFNRLTVTAVFRDHKNKAHARALCSCGSEWVGLLCSLRNGSTRSCGCLQKEFAATINRTHGLSVKHPLYSTWSGIHQRCLNPKSPSYRHYGGRGITMDERWQRSFAQFLADVGERPSDAHSLDRIDNSKGYFPGNVRWATPTQQNRNKRNNKVVSFDGRDWPLKELTGKLGVEYDLVRWRLNHGWDLDAALSAPAVTLYKLRTSDEVRTLPDWAEVLKIKYSTLYSRLKSGRSDLVPV